MFPKHIYLLKRPIIKDNLNILLFLPGDHERIVSAPYGHVTFC